MATEQYLRHSVVGDSTDNWKSSSASTDVNSSVTFDCNICLESVLDPVVTICGHLYCWPCIYKWIHQQSVSSETPQCPVCKAEISERTLIPLYGRGQSLTGSDEKDASLRSVIPDRPRRPSCGAHHDYPPSPGQEAAYYPNYTSADRFGLAGNSASYPIINMFGEMMYTRLFGNSESFYAYPISYGTASVGSPRARRHMMLADQSLSRRSFFLCCCLVLCLLLF